jgi:hypothetical protein
MDNAFMHRVTSGIDEGHYDLRGEFDRSASPVDGRYAPGRRI